MKTSLLAATLAIAALSSGCVGPNKTFNAVNNWNNVATDNKYVNEAIFLGFWIFPVYEFAYLGDVVIFNTINFWNRE